jgi:hypothetical protein
MKSCDLITVPKVLGEFTHCIIFLHIKYSAWWLVLHFACCLFWLWNLVFQREGHIRRDYWKHHLCLTDRNQQECEGHCTVRSSPSVGALMLPGWSDQGEWDERRRNAEGRYERCLQCAGRNSCRDITMEWPRHRCENNIKIDFREIRLEGMD